MQGDIDAQKLFEVKELEAHKQGITSYECMCMCCHGAKPHICSTIERHLRQHGLDPCFQWLMVVQNFLTLYLIYKKNFELILHVVTNMVKLFYFVPRSHIVTKKVSLVPKVHIYLFQKVFFVLYNSYISYVEVSFVPCGIYALQIILV